MEGRKLWQTTPSRRGIYVTRVFRGSISIKSGRMPLAFCRQPGVTLHFVHLDRELVNTNFKEVSVMAKHHPDLIFCRKQPGVAIGRLCEKCDGKCVICDSYVKPCTLVRICDECNYGSYQGRCVICGGPGVSDAYYCKECTIQEKDRDGCPKIVNLGSAKTDLFYERKKYGFKKR